LKKVLSVLLTIIFVVMPLSILADDAATTSNFIQASDQIIKQYMDATDALVDTIVNSSTNVSVSGTTYYVSSSMGDDSNDGLTESTPWKTISKVSNFAGFNDGDAVMFKRGDEFRYTGTLKAQNGVTYSAYGSGAKPKLICSVDASGADNWQLTDTAHVYKYLGEVGGLDTNVGAIVFNDGAAWGIHVMKGADGNRVNNGSVFNGIQSYVTETGVFEGVDSLSSNLEFWHDTADEILYVYSEYGNPGAVFESIELVDDDAAITLQVKTFEQADSVIETNQYSHDILIDNLEIFGACFGVSGQSVKDVTVQYCVFKWIGGCIQNANGMAVTGLEYARYGNAVESFGACDNFVIQYNYASQVYDCAWTAQHTGVKTFNDLVIRNNVAEFANTGPEVWLNANGGSGAVVTNMKIYDNYNRFMGYGWSHERPGDGPHGGVFYGAYVTHQTEGSTFSNNDVYNNVSLFVASSLGNARFIHSNTYNFHDNIYIMEEGTKFGKLDPWDGATTYMYDAEDIATLTAAGYESGSIFYYTEEDLYGNMYDLYMPYGNEADIYGDVDSDGVVNAVDLVKISRRLANWFGYEDYKNPNADVDNDGAFSVKDGIILSRHWAGWLGYENLPYGG